ncbi:dTDP-4-dehydrorhamnose reductase [Roseibium polysiphoniae]|uniref:dTDP-4-dehydrorhamnose reductase n=1 Tax=Roseibium polysiphoniae TaxID=2571221 RepID=A0ABR9C9R6_9HYPH|nr:dTDP-4-dehydrorhamnose reductase [Roseibium polysiphoniae]
MEVLVTGAEGQLGFEVAGLCRERGLTVAALAHRDLDITDRKSIDAAISRYRPKVIVNAAAFTAVDKAEADRNMAFAVNRDGAGDLAIKAAEVDASIIHISTDYVFDGSKKSPYSEDDPVAPLGIYGHSKAAGENAVRTSNGQHVILRTAWVYGMRGKNFVKTMLRLGADQKEISVVNDQWGCPTYARDLAEVIAQLSARLLSGSFNPTGYGTFHCAGGGGVSWYGFAEEIFRLAAERVREDLLVKAVSSSGFPAIVRRPANSILDCGHLERIHGLKLRPWDVALADMLGRFQLHDRPGLHFEPGSIV